jgi:cytochrome P450
LAVIFAGAVRVALVDTVILGYNIPKGTDIFMLHGGPGYHSVGFPIDENRRSRTCKEASRQFGSWDLDDVAEFKPERWLKDGEFTPTAGPHLAFGLGPRGCFGRRLGYLDMKIILVLLIWNFEFEKCPAELSTYKAVDKMSRHATQCFVRLKCNVSQRVDF